MDRISKQIKKYIAIGGSILCLTALLYFTTNNLEASLASPESLLAPKYDVWCEGPPRNCSEDAIVIAFPDQ